MSNVKEVFVHSKPQRNPKKSRLTVAGIIDMDAKEIRIHGARNNTKLKEVFRREKGREIALGRVNKHPLLIIKLNNTKDRKKVQKRWYEAANFLMSKPYKITEDVNKVARAFSEHLKKISVVQTK